MADRIVENPVVIRALIRAGAVVGDICPCCLASKPKSQVEEYRCSKCGHRWKRA